MKIVMMLTVRRFAAILHNANILLDFTELANDKRDNATNEKKAKHGDSLIQRTDI